MAFFEEIFPQSAEGRPHNVIAAMYDDWLGNGSVAPTGTQANYTGAPTQRPAFRRFVWPPAEATSRQATSDRKEERS